MTEPTSFEIFTRGMDYEQLRTNAEILSILQKNREITAFAKFLGLTRQGLYKLLESQEIHRNQYWNYIRYLESKQ